ncbi:UDP-N-acetylglucosamine 1-carboxyvinyltransferase [Leptolyngbya valderiana BDU 20041]|nr:UDP-N-acetylglucosamine 1-carboxyvinyltransferase [Leptolyngbya valderiana BDU 20041]
MDAFVIEGGKPISGRFEVHGSKNAALPMLAAALLTDEPVELSDVPRLEDISNMLRLLAELGVDVTEQDGPSRGGRLVRTVVTDTSLSHARYDIVRTMRAGVCVLGPMLARRGEARISMPGGCAIGPRPIDLHLKGLAALGASISLSNGDVVAKAPAGGLKGATVFLGGPFGSTVLGTANIMSAATLAHGRTVIESAACEPEVVDLGRLLQSMGASISGLGTPRIVIDGVEQLGGATRRIMPDRIEAGTYAMAAAMTRGELTIANWPVDALVGPFEMLRAAGIELELSEHAPLETTGGDSIRATAFVRRTGALRPVELTTQPFPGFPTDLQAQALALLTLADGNSIITEKIFPERFLHVAELLRMGAQIIRHGPTAVISGVPKLVGAPVMASDLRASAGLVLAGLAARGRTIVRRVYHLDRGYQRMDEYLNGLGADIQRVNEKSLEEVAVPV